MELIESRRLLEPVTTRLAAERASDERIAQLAELLERGQDGGAHPHRGRYGVGSDFHAELAASGGNVMLGSVVAQLVNVEQHPLWRLINEQALRAPGARESQRAQHHAILQAVAERDADRAEAEMRNHLEELQSYIFAPGMAFARASEVRPRIELPTIAGAAADTLA